MTIVTADMLTENRIINVNDEIKMLNNLFKTNGWQIETVDKLSESIIYSKKGNETEFFKIEVDNNNVYVSVPLKNSTFQYKTKFNNYYSAIKYVETKFYYFIENENENVVL